jgi:hypothetical protein
MVANLFAVASKEYPENYLKSKFGNGELYCLYEAANVELILGHIADQICTAKLKKQ